MLLMEWDPIIVHIDMRRLSQKFYRRSDFFENLGASTTPFSFRGSPSLGAETQF